MTELKRLLDETESGAERALLQAGRSYRSSRETLSKTLTALGLAGSSAIVVGTATVGTTAAAAAGVSATLPPLAKITGVSGAKVLLALSAAGAATAVPLGYRALHRQVDQVAVVHHTAERRPTGAEARQRAVPPPALDLGEVPAPASEDTQGDAQGATTPPPPARSRAGGMKSPAVSLSQELAALEAARAALARGNPGGALFLLDGYDRSCPRGKMALEAEMLRIDAFAKDGQSHEARRRAEQFVKRHPTSLLAARARTYLDD